MARSKSKSPGVKAKPIADNRKARRNYDIGERFEAGLSLMGTEVKALRESAASLGEAYVDARDGELWLVNCHIPEYSHGHLTNHEPLRPRRLLMHRRQINKLSAAVQRQGMTIVPLSLYFNPAGRVKMEVALAKGRKMHDRRADEKRRDWERQKGRLLRTDV